MKFELSFTNKEITPWGGMVFLKQMLDKIGFREQIENCAALPVSLSNNSYKKETLIESFVTSIWCGANRFLHTEITRSDKALGKIFGWQKVPAQNAYKLSIENNMVDLSNLPNGVYTFICSDSNRSEVHKVVLNN